eukprot:NODE_723_length_1227_cov_104.109508_g579_i0.p1 GENE.NODE_723_length_1227_cov_104.109508_g579_i0~~NODE_723_length_1227_cov_104.109508_g579_i0.p1  ORF type:complete len:279 (-),score=127.54 NODE_723_length_1227_cov_104.109508_g579_i0:257-1093(-)
MLGGAAHLVPFRGSDTIAGVWMANKYYHIDMAGFSIPAAEHSTMTMWGKDNEKEAFRNMIRQYGEEPIFACVSDSYDIYNAVEHVWGEELKQEVLNMKAKLVVRPDSGDPVKVVTKLCQILDEKFGHTINSKGFKVINKVAIIQGDGVDQMVVGNVLEAVIAQGYSASNIAFGSGGALLQKFHRDTCKFAFKCSWAMVDGKSVEVYKEPKEDTTKVSKRGRLDLIRDPATGEPTTVRLEDGQEAHPDSLMVTVYEDGRFSPDATMDEIRRRADECFHS